MRNVVAGKQVRDNSLGAGKLESWSLVMGWAKGSSRKRETEALTTTNHRRMPLPGAESKSQHYRKSPGCALVTSAQGQVPK